MSYNFTIPFLPPSENSLYGWNRMTKKKYLLPKVRQFKNNCKAYIPDIPNLVGKLLKVTFRFFGNWYFKNGKLKRKDGQNLTKALIDAIFEKINIDDCYIWTSSWEKVLFPAAAYAIKLRTTLLSIPAEQN